MTHNAHKYRLYDQDQKICCVIAIECKSDKTTDSKNEAIEFAKTIQHKNHIKALPVFWEVDDLDFDDVKDEGIDKETVTRARLLEYRG